MDVGPSSSDIDTDEVEEHLVEPPETSSPYAALSNTSQEDITHAGYGSFLCMRTLMDVDPPEDNVEENFAETSASPLRVRQETVKPKTRGPYRRYTPRQIEKFFDLVIEEGKTAKEAVLITGINVQTAQNYIKMYKNDEERRLPGIQRKPRAGRPAKLNDAHSRFLIEFIDKNPTAVLADINRNLCEAFEGLAISDSALHRHLADKCCLTLKKLEKLPAARNTDRIIALRKEKVEQREQIPDMDFGTNCVFIDEAGFNLHIQRNFGRSLRGKPAKGIVPIGKGISITILGAISDAGVIDISVRKPEAVSTSKKRKANGENAKINGQVGTRTEHFLNYISNVMDVLDKNSMKGHHLVMDNAPIHTPEAVRKLIESRGYKCLYLPLYSPFLNPIEEFWSKVKGGVRIIALRADDRLTDRICDSVNKVTRSGCQGYIRHAMSFFSRCKNEEMNL